MRILSLTLFSALLASSAMAADTSPSEAVSKTAPEIQSPLTCLKVNEMKLKVYPDNTEYRRKTVSWRMALKNDCTKMTGFEIRNTFLDKDGFELPSTINIMDLGGMVKMISPKEQTATGTFGVKGDTFENAETITMKLGFGDERFHESTFKIDDIYPDREVEKFDRFNHACLQTDGGVMFNVSNEETKVDYNVSANACPTQPAMPVYGRLVLTGSKTGEKKTIELGKLDREYRDTRTYKDFFASGAALEVSPDATWKTVRSRKIRLDVVTPDSKYQIN